MKRKIIFLVLFVAYMAFGVCVLKAGEYVEMGKIVDLGRVKANMYTDFIQYAFWPKQEVFTAKKSENRLIEKDLQDFTNILARLIREEYLPSSEDIKSAIGVPAYIEGDDFLFLRYTTKSGVHVEIQDGRGVYISMSSADWRKVPIAKIETFVKDTALRSINFPQDTGKTGNILVGASSIDIGPSRCGALAWKLDGEPASVQISWYSLIMWWSDGQRILFAISKMSKDDYANLATVANRAGQREPRRFQYRKDSSSLESHMTKERPGTGR